MQRKRDITISMYCYHDLVLSMSTIANAGPGRSSEDAETVHNLIEPKKRSADRLGLGSSSAHKSCTVDKRRGRVGMNLSMLYDDEYIST